MRAETKILVISPYLGAFSEAWLWRQIHGFQETIPIIITWRYLHKDEFPLPNIKVYELNDDFNKKKNIFNRYFSKFLTYFDQDFSELSEQQSKMILDIIREHNPVSILCHFAYTADRIWRILRQIEIPFFIHCHGRDIQNAVVRNFFNKKRLETIFSKCAGVVVVGTHQRLRLLENFNLDKKKIYVNPCGVDADFFYPKTRKIRAESREVIFLSVARLCSQKGFEYSLTAFANLARRVADCKYFIIGDGPKRKYLENYSKKLNIEKKVFFLGFQTQDKVREFMQDSDIFLQHSLDDEGFSISICEALACGLPVVATNVGGIPDQIIDGFNGFLVDQKDVGKMADKMLILARDNDLRVSMSKNARQTALKFDIRKQISQLENILIDHLSV